MTAASLASFNAQALTVRYGLHGKSIKLDNRPGFGVYAAPRRTDQLDPNGGGYRTEITSTLRLLKADWPSFKTAADFFKKEVQIKLGDAWQRFRIADQGVMDVHLSGEWKLELEALT